MKQLYFIIMPTLCALLTLTSGCTYTKYAAIYSVSLTDVERPAGYEEVLGKPRYSGNKSVHPATYYFEDSAINSSWGKPRTALEIRLTNKTKNTIKVIWRDALFVDHNGVSYRVFHDSKVYQDFLDWGNAVAVSHFNSSMYGSRTYVPDKPEAGKSLPTIIKGGATHSDFIIPEDGPFASSVFPSWKGTRDEAKAEAGLIVGKQVRVLLPIEIRGKVLEYIFSFKVTDFRIEEKKTTIY